MRFENKLTAEIELGTYMLSDKERWFPRHWICAVIRELCMSINLHLREKLSGRQSC
jgi:hypothetical protein